MTGGFVLPTCIPLLEGAPASVLSGSNLEAAYSVDAEEMHWMTAWVSRPRLSEMRDQGQADSGAIRRIAFRRVGIEQRHSMVFS
jgi:hypothetical protein